MAVFLGVFNWKKRKVQQEWQGPTTDQVTVVAMQNGEEPRSCYERRVKDTKVQANKRSLQKQLQFLDAALCETAMAIDDINKEREAVADSRAALSSTVHDISDAFNSKLREIQLKNLQTIKEISEETENYLSIQEEDQTAQLARISALKERVEIVLKKGTVRDVIRLFQSCEELRKTYVAKKMSTRRRLAMFRKDATYSLETQLEASFGTVHEVLLEADPAELAVVRTFVIPESIAFTIVSLCHVDKTPPAVSLVVENTNGERSRTMLDDMGLPLEKEEIITVAPGRRYAKGRLMFPSPVAGCTGSFSKSLTAPHFRLNSSASGKGKLFRASIDREDPLAVSYEPEMTFRVGTHRSFDVTDQGDAIVVLEESQGPNQPRQVRLYRKRQEEPVTTYKPPVDKFQPSDVCFFRLKGQPVLLVADSGNNTIHVVQVQNQKLQFQRFMALGPITLFKPVYLNVDIDGHLWVACQNGKVLCMQ